MAETVAEERNYFARPTLYGRVRTRRTATHTIGTLARSRSLNSRVQLNAQRE